VVEVDAADGPHFERKEMESLSRTLDTYTGSYVAKRRRKRIIWGIAVFLALAAAIGGIVYLGKSYSSSGKSGSVASKRAVLANWRAKNWDAVLSSCSSSLSLVPLDAFYLGFSGLASFYKGVELPEGEERAALMDQAITAIRKALVPGAHGGNLPKPELEYVLGKAYYNKGEAYWDETVKYLEASIKDGYLGQDSREYLAVAYAGLGNNQKAIDNFNAALSRKKSDLLLIATARAYVNAGQTDRAESLLLEALSLSSDALAREKCRFILADIYNGRGEAAKAKDQLNLVITENPDSADAHYQLGLVYQKEGDPIHARAEWRRAVSIDPMHALARQKLAEKL
jgi:tetratricopeptide (TPR) repeat protein